MTQTTLPKRKTIRLKDFDYSSDGAYFITICVEGKKCLFGNVGTSLCARPQNSAHSYMMVKKWLFELEHKFIGVKIDKYVIMPNHIHFILVLDRADDRQRVVPLQEIISWFKTMTTNEYIKGVNANLYQPFDKRVWQHSYYEHIIRNEEDYQNIWNYIDTNPLKWQDDEYYWK